MIRLILFVVVALLVIVGGLAVALFHLFRWKGLVIFPFILIALVWLAKVIITQLVKRFALGLFGLKAGVLRGATMNVHSIKSIPKPPEREIKTNSIEAGDESAGELAEEGDETNSTSAEPPAPNDYMEVDVTITPKDKTGNAVWEPSELMLTTDKIKSLADLEDKEAGTAHSVEIWNGTSFGPDDPGKYPGEQRLKIIFTVNPGTALAWLHYYNEPIGQLKLPPGTIDV